MYIHILVSVDYNKSEKSLTPNIMNKNTIHMFRLFFRAAALIFYAISSYFFLVRLLVLIIVLFHSG